VNGRIALRDMRMPGTGAKLELAVWARNLLGYRYLFVKSASALGYCGAYNDPRTVGVEANVRF